MHHTAKTSLISLMNSWYTVHTCRYEHFHGYSLYWFTWTGWVINASYRKSQEETKILKKRMKHRMVDQHSREQSINKQGYCHPRLSCFQPLALVQAKTTIFDMVLSLHFCKVPQFPYRKCNKNLFKHYRINSKMAI